MIQKKKKKCKKLLNKKLVKVTKQKHAFKGCPSTYNVEILDSESATKSKLIELLTQLKGFKFVASLVLVFKKIQS